MSDFKILIERVTALTQFTAKGVLFNLNYMPDTILGGIVLFALIMQSGPLAILGLSLFSLEFVHAGLAAFLLKAIPGLNEASKDVSRCSGHFPGISYERATSYMLSEATLKSLSVSFPSYYMMFFGALFGYMFAMAQTYERELKAMPQKRAGIFSGVVVMGLLSVMFALYRIGSSCDSVLSVIVGSLTGVLFGYLVESTVAVLSGRDLTNLMNVPLIRDNAVDGKPIYVCKKQ